MVDFILELLLNKKTFRFTSKSDTINIMKQTDYLVIGAGIAGLTTAYLLSEFGSVLVITKGKLQQSNTYWAQGGIAAVLDKEDSFQSYINDTMKTGAMLNNEMAVKYLVENSAKAIRLLESFGIKFQKEPVREGGHSCSRVWRTSDFTGQDVLNQLIKIVKKKKNIKIQEKSEAVELIEKNKECYGAFIRVKESEDLTPILAKNTILATGGLGQLFGKTTNTLGSGGDGLALALNIDLELNDIEFIQFHPTALDIVDNGRYFLLSEALRGFGAKVVNRNGEQFLSKFDKRGELGPRDLIARTIYFELMNGSVYLDMRHIDSKLLKKSFPNIYKRVKNYGFNLAENLVPITPVAHYSCGGVPVDLNGATKLSGLYAVGEVACTGVHGANRLASNSLLEAVVFSIAVADSLEKSISLDKDKNFELKGLNIPQVAIEDIAQVKAYSKRLGNIMWKYAGIIRSTSGLKKAKKEIESIPARDYRVKHRQLVCYKILEACISRSSSLGAHYITSELV